MRQPWQNIFQTCHLQLSAWAAFLNIRTGGRGHRAPLLLSPPPLPLPPFPAPPLFPPSPLNSDLTTVVECNLLPQKPSPPLRMDLFSRHGGRNHLDIHNNDRKQEWEFALWFFVWFALFDKRASYSFVLLKTANCSFRSFKKSNSLSFVFLEAKPQKCEINLLVQFSHS